MMEIKIMSITKEYSLITPLHNSELCNSSDLAHNESYIIINPTKNFVALVHNTLLVPEFVAQLDNPSTLDTPKFSYGPMNATKEEISEPIAMTDEQWLTFRSHLQHDTLYAADYIATLITLNDADPKQHTVGI